MPDALVETLALAPGALADYQAAVAQARAAGAAPEGGAGFYRSGETVIVPISGFLQRAIHAPQIGLSSYLAIAQAIGAALDDGSVSSIVLHVNSAGGEVAGLWACVDAVAAARGSKPIVALVDELALSAGYALASAADKVILASSTAQVGSVGVMAAHLDQSGALAKAGLKVTLVHAGKHKVDGNPTEPLPDDVRIDMQRDVDTLHAQFVERVALYRGMSASAVRATEARVFRGADAVSAGFADAIAAPSAVLQALSNSETGMTLQNLAPAPTSSGTGPGAATEPARVEDILAAASSAGLTEAQSLALVREAAAANLRIEQVREIAANVAAQRSIETRICAIAPSAHNRSTLDDPRNFAVAAGEALAARSNPAIVLSGPSQQFGGLGISDLAREVLRRHGRNAVGSPAQVIGATMQGFHTRSDFSAILENFTHRTLRDAFLAAPSGIRQVGREVLADDFRDIRRVALGEWPALEKVNEHGEFRSGTIGESGERYRVETFGRVIGISRQALINDDLQAFADLARRAGQSARELEARILVGLINANPVMSDGNAFFSAAHGNLAGTGTPIATGLGAARQAMRTQRGIDGDMMIETAPRYLVVGADREEEGEKALAAINATTIQDVNPFSNLTLVVEPRLSGAWHLFSDPSVLAALEYAYLGGARTPEILAEEGFTVDGLRMRVRHDFGAGFIEHRAAFRNPGA